MNGRTLISKYRDMFNVLIADDDVDSWFQVNSLLRRYSIKANFVTNVNAAKQYADLQKPALLFFDKDFQDQSPVDFIKYIRSKHPQVKVIIVNTYSEDSMDFKFKADLTISKPLAPEIIEQAIIKLLYPQLKPYEVSYTS